MTSVWTCGVAAEADSSTIRLFCFPFGGGGTRAFATWGRALGQRFEVCPAHLPGREERIRDPAITDMTRLVDEIMLDLRQVTTERFALFGHSLGALVAFEVAQRLARTGEAPRLLAVSGQAAPHLSRRRPRISHLPEKDFVAALLREFEVGPALRENPSLLSMVAPILQADFRLVESYTFTESPSLQCPIIAFGGESDAEASVEEVGAWRSQTTGSFGLRTFPGGHFYLVEKERALLRALRADLDAACSSELGPRT